MSLVSRTVRTIRGLLRGLFLFLFVLVALAIYGLGRLGLWLTVRDRAQRASRVANWQGVVLRRSMTLLGATFIKMGQVLSSRPDLLPPEIIAQLSVLQDRLPAFSYGRARRAVERDLGRKLTEVYSEFDGTPVAAASVAQVHRGRLKDGTEVAIKVLRPSIRGQVERDATILLLGARLLALHPTLRLSDPVGHLRHFVEAIICQTDLTIEAANYQRFADNFADIPAVTFPKVYPEHSGTRVLTMEFVRGTRFDDRDRTHDKTLARTIRRMMFKMCFTDGFVHADLHPGNFFIEGDHRLVVFDAGMAKLLSDEVLVQFIDFSRCLTVGTVDDVVNHIKQFHTYIGELDWDGLRKDVARLLGGFRGKNAATLEYSKLFTDIFAIARTYRARPMPDLTLVMVALLTVQGIGKVLDPSSNVFEEVGTFIVPLMAQKGIAPGPISQAS